MEPKSDTDLFAALEGLLKLLDIVVCVAGVDASTFVRINKILETKGMLN